MAESALSFVLDKLGPLVVEEAKLLRAVRDEVREIKDELESSRSFLIDADKKGESGRVKESWVKQVRELAYDMEDIIDEFNLSLAQRPHGDGLLNFLQDLSYCIIDCRARHGIASEIQAVKTEFVKISNRANRYESLPEPGPSSSGANNTLHDPREDAVTVGESELVGIEKRKDELIEWLVRAEETENKSSLRVVSVFGTAGLGKTTLFRKVYDSPKVKEVFKYHAWVSVTQSFDIEKLLRDLINQLFVQGNAPIAEEVGTMKATELILMLKDYLQQKRYAVVFDDVWIVDVLKGIENALPDNGCGSRIMVTTRKEDVANFCKGIHGWVYKLPHLPEEDAWILFCRKAFKSEPQNSCPRELKEVSEKIFKRCERLPLAIVSIAGLLSCKRMTYLEWDKVERSFSLQLVRDPVLGGTRMVFLLSYIELPDRLKACFLYLSIFPKSCVVKCRRLIRLWIAEGLVERWDDMSMEEVAETYLDDLINRSLIQVGETDLGGRARTCRVHEIMQLILKRAQEQNFSTVLVEEDAITTLPESPDRIRRLSILNSKGNIRPNISFPHLRSAFIFAMEDLSSSSISILLSNVKVLRVLDLEDAPMEDFPSELLKLLHLRYLSLKNTKIKSLPDSLGQLEKLETLDLRGTYVTQLPVKILKLEHLCNLLVYQKSSKSFGGKDGVRLPIGTGNLKVLEKLSCFDADGGSAVVQELALLTRLRKLSITGLRREDGIHLCNSIGKMMHLRSFDVASKNEKEVLDVQSSLLSPLLRLHHLCMQGVLEGLPQWIPKLENLVKLKLECSRLTNDPLQDLQALSNLVELTLQRAYDGQQLCFAAEIFPRLKILELIELAQLNLVKVEKKAMSVIEKIKFEGCKQLKLVPLGIENLTELKEIVCTDMPSDFADGIEKRDFWKHEYLLLVTVRRESRKRLRPAVLAVIAAGFLTRGTTTDATGGESSSQSQQQQQQVSSPITSKCNFCVQ